MYTAKMRFIVAAVLVTACGSAPPPRPPVVATPPSPAVLPVSLRCATDTCGSPVPAVVAHVAAATADAASSLALDFDLPAPIDSLKPPVAFAYGGWRCKVLEPAGAECKLVPSITNEADQQANHMRMNIPLPAPAPV